MVFSQAPPCRPTTFAHGGGLQRWDVHSFKHQCLEVLEENEAKALFSMLFVFLRCLLIYILSEDVIPLKWYNGDLFSPFLSSSSWVKKGESTQGPPSPKSQQDSHVSVEPVMGVKIGVSF